ncbi:MAG: hypothetical protein P1P90_03685 [Patescibacteria group bacterium]|nr:hypothetical protein [Patescibacteria group bacterium]
MKKISKDPLGDMLLKMQKLGEEEGMIAIDIAVLISFTIAFIISRYY